MDVNEIRNELVKWLDEYEEEYDPKQMYWDIYNLKDKLEESLDD